jgi:hypothetical protein
MKVTGEIFSLFGKGVFRKTLTEFTKKNIPNPLGRIFQVKRQSKKVMPLFFYSVFLFIKIFLLKKQI